jgi:lipopolysaccharide export system permease protein
MTRLDRYVLQQLAVGMIFVTAGLTCVLWLTQSLRFVEMIVNRGLSAGTFLYLTMLLLPNFLAVILPVALFAIVLFTYSKMVTDRELVVMRAAGLSQMALAKPALVLAILVLGLGYALNLYFLPTSYRMFHELQWEIRYSYSHILLQEGKFSTINDAITVYVRERSPEGELLGILIHDTRNPAKPTTLMAERGAMVQTDEGTRVVLFNGNRQELDRATNKVSMLYFDRYTFDLEATREAIPVRYREPRERMLPELLHPEDDPMVQAKDRGKFIVEAHQRLSSPLQSISFTLIALASLISGGFSRRSQAARVGVAIAIVVTLEGAILGMANFTAKHLDLIPLNYAIVVIPGAIAAYLMLRSGLRSVPRSPGAAAEAR